MGYRGRIYFTEKQKAEIWDRWQRGESMSFDRADVRSQFVVDLSTSVADRRDPTARSGSGRVWR